MIKKKEKQLGVSSKSRAIEENLYLLQRHALRKLSRWRGAPPLYMCTLFLRQHFLLHTLNMRRQPFITPIEGSGRGSSLLLVTPKMAALLSTL